MNRCLDRSFEIDQLSAGTLEVLEEVPLFSVTHPPVVGLDEAGNYTPEVENLHAQIAAELGLTNSKERYPFKGLGRNWHRDGHFLFADDDNYCLYTTVRHLALVYAANILTVEGLENLPSDFLTARVVKEAGAQLQVAGRIGLVAKVVTTQKATAVWRECSKPLRDTAHAAVATRRDRKTYSTRWQKADASED